MDFVQKNDTVEAYVTFERDGIKQTVHASGNGSLNAVSNALKAYTGDSYKLLVYTEHSMESRGSNSTAAAYLGIQSADGKMSWGVGVNTDIIRASANALLSAYNSSIRK